MVVNLLAAAPDTEIYVERMRLAFDGDIVVIDTLDSLNKSSSLARERHRRWMIQRYAGECAS